MLIWLLANVALPLLPLLIIAVLSGLLRWERGLVHMLGDGQLYFFSVALCGVFGFDASRGGKLDPLHYAVVAFVMIFLSCLYMASVFITNSGAAAGEEALTSLKLRKLALTSVIATIFTIAGVAYLRYESNLL